MKISLLTILLFFTITISNKAQIISRRGQPSPFPSGLTISKSTKFLGLDPKERRELAKQDSVEAIYEYPRRFGRNFDSDIDIVNETKAQSMNGKAVRLYEISSKGAFSINLIFDKLFLSPGSELNIYNHDRSFVYGPVNTENVPSNGVLWTDLIPGDRIIIELIERNGNSGKSSLHISSVVHGYRKAWGKGSENIPNNFGDSYTCHNDITCPKGNGWREEGDAVGMVMTALGTRFCSGALVNNQRQDFKPYFLTAFHCLDADKSGSLSTTEKSAANNWAYVFKYQSPTCEPLADGICYISFNGANVKAGLQATDFALLELVAQPRINHGVSFAGWDKSAATVTSAVGIHHPSGDVKKISFENNSIYSNPSPIGWAGGLTSPNNSHWVVGFDDGTTESASSGSPLFDQNQRIVGQLNGGSDGCAPITKYYGRFDKSWSLGGTSETQLKNWLDPDNTGINTINTLYSRVSGPALICTNGTFTVDNISVGVTVSWSSSNTSVLTINSSGTATRVGSGSGLVTVTAIVPNTCSSITLTKTVYVGNPNLSKTINGIPAGTTPVVAGNLYNLAASSNSPSTTFSYNNYAGTGDITIDLYSPSSATTQMYVYSSSTTGYRQVKVTATNTCGSYYEDFVFYLASGLLKAYPNPAKDVLTLEFNDASKAESLPKTVVLYHETSTVPAKSVNVQDVFGKKGFANGNKIELNVSNLARGVYYLHVGFDESTGKTTEKMRIVLE